MLREFGTGAPPSTHACTCIGGGHPSGDDWCALRRADNASKMAGRRTKIKCGEKPPWQHRCMPECMPVSVIQLLLWLICVISKRITTKISILRHILPSEMFVCVFYIITSDVCCACICQVHNSYFEILKILSEKVKMTQTQWISLILACIWWHCVNIIYCRRHCDW